MWRPSFSRTSTAQQSSSENWGNSHEDKLFDVMTQVLTLDTVPSALNTWYVDPNPRIQSLPLVQGSCTRAAKQFCLLRRWHKLLDAALACCRFICVIKRLVIATVFITFTFVRCSIPSEREAFPDPAAVSSSLLSFWSVNKAQGADASAVLLALRASSSSSAAAATGEERGGRSRRSLGQAEPSAPEGVKRQGTARLLGSSAPLSRGLCLERRKGWWWSKGLPPIHSQSGRRGRCLCLTRRVEVTRPSDALPFPRRTGSPGILRTPKSRVLGAISQLYFHDCAFGVV